MAAPLGMWLLTGVLMPVAGSFAGVFFGPMIGLEAPWWAWTLISFAFLGLRNSLADEEMARSIRALRDEVAELVANENDDQDEPTEP